MDFIIKRSGKDEKSVAWSFFSFSSCFIDLIPNFVSNIGFRISRWRETELKGNPVQIRNYPRSCKFYPHSVGKCCDILSHWLLWKPGRRYNGNKSEDLPLLFISFMAFGWKAIERIILILFITGFHELSCVKDLYWIMCVLYNLNL